MFQPPIFSAMLAAKDLGSSKKYPEEFRLGGPARGGAFNIAGSTGWLVVFYKMTLVLVCFGDS